jgi:hypothetical protein
MQATQQQRPSSWAAVVQPRLSGVGLPIPAAITVSNGTQDSTVGRSPAPQQRQQHNGMHAAAVGEVSAPAPPGNSSGSSVPGGFPAAPEVQRAAAGTQAIMRQVIREGKECIVCMEARSCVLQAPCGHLCCCKACTELLLGKSQECPMCRTQVTEYWVL